ncbi:hypothetical protein [Methylobacterium sp. J-076]|uniref:hypothetical protein n=1 Tax=Methylobacterium sp. J-076 TaxID=2836655 RepID=UPI001FB9893E|nr:hypothetical protein [Methylobacterium sp. J-076]MCJ2015577.1 hypothetical protein [Methylobacterium sp. J-076]
MGAPLNIAITYASEKGSDINGAEADANFHALVAAIQTLATMGSGTGIAAIEIDPNTQIATFVDTNNVVLGAFTLPSRPVRPAGVWAAAVKYAAGDVVRISASATVPLGLVALATKIFTSDAKDAAVDLASGAMMPLVYDGAPFATQRGTYSDTYTYAVGDVVFYPATATYYRLMQPTPAASKPDRPILAADGTVSVPWTPVSVPGYRAIRIRADGLPAAGAVVCREMMDRFGTFGANMVPANAPGSGPSPILRAKTAAKALCYFTVKLNGTSIGLLAFAANSAVAGFTTTGGKTIQVNLGDVLEIFAPATQDATLADVLGFLNLTVY